MYFYCSKRTSAASEESLPPEEGEKEEDDGASDVKKPKEPSKRFLKKQKIEQRELNKIEAGKKETVTKALEYISVVRKNLYKFPLIILKINERKLFH